MTQQETREATDRINTVPWTLKDGRRAKAVYRDVGPKELLRVQSFLTDNGRVVLEAA